MEQWILRETWANQLHISVVLKWDFLSKCIKFASLSVYFCYLLDLYGLLVSLFNDILTLWDKVSLAALFHMVWFLECCDILTSCIATSYQFICYVSWYWLYWTLTKDLTFRDERNWKKETLFKRTVLSLNKDNFIWWTLCPIKAHILNRKKDHHDNSQCSLLASPWNENSRHMLSELK